MYDNIVQVVYENQYAHSRCAIVHRKFIENHYSIWGLN